MSRFKDERNSWKEKIRGAPEIEHKRTAFAAVCPNELVGTDDVVGTELIFSPLRADRVSGSIEILTQSLSMTGREYRSTPEMTPSRIT
mmetsp:Transcript_666/g.1377  ORF Transcript_666/g.1377 Transcript_666/m.1377 type:complete len:88 (-) Transcript_666:784-1047(-)